MSETKKISKQPPTLGYPQIEGLLETEDFSRVNKTFAEAYGKLEGIIKDRTSGLKKQKEAQKAMQSYELTVELMNELLKIKKEIVRLRKEKAGVATKK